MKKNLSGGLETFNSEPWFEKWTEKTAEKRLSHCLNNESCVGIVSAEGEEITGMLIGEEEQYYDGVVCVIKEFCVKNAIAEAVLTLISRKQR